MHYAHQILVTAITATLTLAACQSPPISSALTGEPPQVLSVVKRDGKGLPNGRSDSVEPFIQEIMVSSTDSQYGYTREKPIKTGPRSSAKIHIRYLNSLRGPSGEPVEYERRTSCCEFATTNSDMGRGLLDVYRVRVDGSSKDVFLYLNMYDPGPPQLLMGFTQR